ncbi:TIGR03086 family metal-binding protein [Streptomyces cylindrosporus]|uniref:TIGR03086 family metal-binding protein n=1 Tax=Streptomyces cylindrosporus TaxID=2927583 RepID=A0ABS9YE61_9ACTN|nr:TIGR03086 family metal-binding protein [Streptomyces cylindrosporus]MCI3275526.1 TIGR03086 family metal-binding protein [Streptomyces cylindrosporus]
MNAGELLERSLAYALGSVAEVAPGGLDRGTPCGEWDLGELLGHLDDSLDALHEGLTGGRIGLFPRVIGAADPACAFRTRACAVLGAWAAGPGERVRVGELPLDVRVMAAVGAVEIAVHGWDVTQACGRPRPIPRPLAADLLPVARCVVAEEDRGVRFGAPVAVPPYAGPDARLLAFLGRRDSFPG